VHKVEIGVISQSVAFWSSGNGDKAWKIVVCVKCHCNQAESNYNSYKGELLALTWSKAFGQFVEVQGISHQVRLFRAGGSTEEIPMRQWL